MYDEQPFTEDYDLTYSTIGTPVRIDNSLRIPIRELGVSKEFPGIQHETIFKTCFLILKGVSSSIREVSEYKTSEAKEFKPSYIVDDGPFPQTSAQKYVFDLSNPSHDPFGWFNWEVVAESVEIEGGEILKVFK